MTVTTEMLFVPGVKAEGFDRPTTAQTMDEFLKEDVWFDYANLYSAVVRDNPDFHSFVEIGVWKGQAICHLARELVKSGRRFSLTAVDRWSDEYAYKRPGPFSLYEAYDYHLRREGLRQHITDIRSDSSAAAARFAPGSLDFVFIDADHEYDGVMLDLRAWTPTVRPGGVVAGHDWNDNWPGVKQAVTEFFVDGLGWTLNVTGTSWWFRVPGGPGAGGR